MPVETVLMVTFVWWEDPISMRVEWRCASITSGEQCVITAGTFLMPLWYANNWNMQPLEVSTNIFWHESILFTLFTCCIGGVAYSNAYFGAGTGPIYLDTVACTLSASQLLECSSRPILTHYCTHLDDAGVGCKGIFNLI